MKRTLNHAAQAVAAAVPADTPWPVLVAYSGGLDSTVLLRAAVTAFGPANCRALHLDHQINEESQRWRRHCERVANDLSIEIVCEAASLQSGNLELQARASRYAFFTRQLNHSQVLLMGHHRDDLVETRLWQLLTGRAMIGIPSTRKLGSGLIARPFLDWTRADLRTIAGAEDLQWIEDPSNEDTSFDRNWIRQRVIPMLERRFPSARQHISAARFQPELEESANPRPLFMRGTPDSESVRNWLGTYGFYPPGATIEEICKQATDVRADSRMSVKVASNAVVCKFDGYLQVAPSEAIFDAREICAGEDFTLSNGRLFWTRQSAGFDVGTKLSLMSRRDATSLGLTTIRHRNRTKSLKNVFQEAKIPYWQRPGWPVIHAAGEILSIPNLILADGLEQTRNGVVSMVPNWIPRSF